MDDEKDTSITSHSEIVEPTQKEKKKLRGFKLTWGRCFDLFIVAINILVFVFTFVAFLCIAIYLITAAARVPESGGTSDQTCILFAGKDDNGNNLDFSSSSICYFILISPVIIWAFLLFFILFLSIKVCRAWKIGLFEIIICVLCIVCLIYNILVSIVLSIGYTLTCSRLAELDDPEDTSVKQSCANGGVKQGNGDGSTTYIEFAGAIATAQVTLWISALILVALSFIHLARLFIFSRRRVKNEEMRSRLKSEKKNKDESGEN
eukprot:TRINITY_DN29131_c0_g1_i1.p1 TRINITY_DN29131_c0_g1~~TRINITY_DN29131_c0_g1_i1.p1  ORF type:complete len:263 (+),score=39.29 TRINITY_DN29131_c0_g1_i1:18-806(+)